MIAYNNTNGSNTAELRPHFLAVYSLTIVFATLSVIGNVWFAAVIIKVKEVNKPNYRIVLNVIFSDLFLNLVTTPAVGIVGLGYTVFNRTLDGDVFCNVITPLQNLVSCFSLYGQLLLACNRYIAAFKPLVYRSHVSNRSATLASFLFACFLPIVILFCLLVTKSIFYEMDTELGKCITQVSSPSAKLVVLGIYTLFPTIPTLFIYGSVGIKIVISTQRCRIEILRRVRGSVCMFLCMLFFTLCFLPNMAFLSSPRITVFSKLWIQFVYRLSFSINPIFYAAFDQQLRRASVQLFHRITRKKFIKKEPLPTVTLELGLDKSKDLPKY